MRCTLQSRPRTGNRVELSDHRFWAECSDKGLSTQYFRPNLRPIYHDVERCQIRITQGKGHKDRQVPFPLSFRELLALHMKGMREKGAIYLFESARKHKYTDRGVRKMLAGALCKNGWDYPFRVPSQMAALPVPLAQKSRDR